jgi:hypothetical protein
MPPSRPQRERRAVERIRSSELASSGLAQASACRAAADAKAAAAAAAAAERQPAGTASVRLVKSDFKQAEGEQAEEASSQRCTPRKTRAHLTSPRSKTAVPAKRQRQIARADGDAKRRRRGEAGDALPVLGGQSGEEEEDTAEDELSEYEKLRKANMDRNKLILEALELPSMPAPAKAEGGMVSVRARGLKGTRKQAEVLPTRERSLRVQGKKPDGQQLELPADWREPVRFNPSSRLSNQDRCSSSWGKREEKVKREEEEGNERRTGDLAVADCVPLDRWADEPEAHLSRAREQAKHLMTELRESDTNASARSCVSTASRADVSLPLSLSVDALQTLAVSESDVAKVCPQRIASIVFHPMENHVVVAAGDKRGNIGIFTPDWHQDDACVTVFKAHCSSVTWLAFDSGSPHSLYSSSYDNIVRRLDVERQVFAEVLALEEDQHDFMSTCHLDAASHVLRCGFGTGHMLAVDVRSSSRPTTVQLHDKTIRSIDVSCGDSNLLLTASIDRTAKLWDIRKLRPTDFIASVAHSQGVTQARFSRGRGKVAMTTSYDDSCKVLDVSSGEVRSTIRRNNCTGRWLSAFQAVFVPGSDGLAAIGSMEQHRGVDIIDVSKGTRACRLTSPAFASITSVNAWHPTRKLLVGGNSSGKVYLWR